MKIVKIDPLGFEDVYNMEVENHHNFSVNGGFIVHNCDAIRYFVAARPCPATPVAATRLYPEEAFDDDYDNLDTFFS